MIAIVDYGVGNLFSLSCSLNALGLEAEITADAEKLRSADRIILPGVGAFGDAAEKLEKAMAKCLVCVTGDKTGATCIQYADALIHML